MILIESKRKKPQTILKAYFVLSDLQSINSATHFLTAYLAIEQKICMNIFP